MSDHYRRKVGDFHRAMNVPRFRDLNRHERMACASLRAELITEEAREMREADMAYRRKSTPANREHLAKELADLMYVTAGTSDVLATPLWDPHHYMAKPTLKPFFAEGMVIQAVSQVVRSLHDLIRICNDADLASDDPAVFDTVDEVGSDVQSLAASVHVLAYAWEIPLLRTYDAVHASNMSKLDPETGAPVLREDGKILKGPGYRDADLAFLSQNAA